MMFQLLNISTSVKNMEIKNYAHMVMLDNFNGKILKTLNDIDSQIRISNLEQSNIKIQDVAIKLDQVSLLKVV